MPRSTDTGRAFRHWTLVAAVLLAGCGLQPRASGASAAAPGPSASPSPVPAAPATSGDRTEDGSAPDDAGRGAPRGVEAGSEAGGDAGSAAGQESAADGGEGLDEGSPPVASAPRSRAYRPYERVIPPEAETSRGLFITHRVGDRLYFEIPEEAFGRDMLLLRRAVGGASGGASHVIRWERSGERSGERVFLREQRFEAVADPDAALSEAVREMESGTIIADFDVETLGPGGAPVIEVSRLYTRNVSQFTGVRSISSARSMIRSAHAFPDNVEIEAIQTGTVVAPGEPSGTAASTNTVRFHWSMLVLPEPMKPRLHDARVGFNSVRHTRYAANAHGSETRRYIRRFRLEKQDPGAELSAPVRPIVFWIDRATPEWLVPWVTQGVEDWQPAFEAAGFREGIVARRAPDPEEDPTWSMYDARHSMIYWRPSTTENANGGQVADPRTGEILKAEVNMFHNVMSLLQRWYFIQAGPLDDRARSLPLPDSLMGRLVSYVVSHEVGHAIGLPHNMKASSAFAVDSLRSASFLERRGSHVPSLMDYSRFNYVAQPEDSIPPELLIPKVGPYDHFSVMWGYRPIDDAPTADDERPVLARWTAVQDTVPWLRFETSGAFNDPGNLTEAVGNADAVRASELGLRNLERVVAMLLPATERPGEDYSLLKEFYGETVQQWGRYMSHVAAVVGGAESRERLGTGRRFEPVSVERQRAAVAFLNRHAFHPPRAFLDPEILRRVEAHGVIARIRTAQGRVLSTLLADNRLNRLIEYEALAESGDAYTIADLMEDVRRGVWTELDSEVVTIDIYRRNLQRAYLDAVDLQLNGSGPASARRRRSSDARPVVRGELQELERSVGAALERAGNSMTRLHLQDVQSDIRKLLEEA